MKVISFSALEILPAFLTGMETKWKEGKTQTIRPAWKYVKVLDTGYEAIRDKLPRFKVGETVRLEWRSRNSPKGSWFWKHDGSFFTRSEKQKQIDVLFPKILGTAKITEVFKIEMGKIDSLRGGYSIGSDKPWFLGKGNDNELIINKDTCMTSTPGLEKFAKRDGFPDANTMFKWFDKHYDLKTPKTFWVYRWKEVDNNGESKSRQST